MSNLSRTVKSVKFFEWFKNHTEALSFQFHLSEIQLLQTTCFKNYMVADKQGLQRTVGG